MRHKVLINPRAAGGRPLELLPKMREWTADHPHTYEYVVTESREQLIAEAKAARNEAFDSVLAMGGDGTMHDVVSTARLDGPLYGMLPCGRGNDFPRNMGYPGTLHRAVQGMRNPSIETIDLPTINGKPFLSIAGVGFDSLIARKVRDSNCRLGGTLCYALALFELLVSFKPVELTFFIDGDTMLNGKYTLVVAANGKAYGGGMRLAPQANIGDGYLDLIYLKGSPKWKILHLFSRVYKGTHMKDPVVVTKKIKSLTIEGDSALEMFADGEYVANLPVTIEVGARKIRVLVPRG